MTAEVPELAIIDPETWGLRRLVVVPRMHSLYGSGAGPSACSRDCSSAVFAVPVTSS
jgi:hypothetical protein